ncbi:DUF6338 family protein [Nonomuraea typhae]|uniref:DUF6338 family protein n=1 Tax=Nonomuraea typhae TaxID=2603600 RepID=A0ABW7ZD31_9ACTN
MADTASTVIQVVLLIVFVLPGFVYQQTRQRLRGARPGDQEFKLLLLRSMLATLVLDIVYVAAGWPLLRPLFGPAPWYGGALADVQRTALVLLVCVLVVPTGVAWAQWGLARMRAPTARRIGPPTAWDHAFRERRRSAMVRIRLKSGGWVGGWYGSWQGTRSYAAEYPHPPDIFVAQAWQMGPDGAFLAPAQNSGGLYVRMEDADVLEFVEKPLQERDPS